MVMTMYLERINKNCDYLHKNLKVISKQEANKVFEEIIADLIYAIAEIAYKDLFNVCKRVNERRNNKPN